MTSHKNSVASVSTLVEETDAAPDTQDGLIGTSIGKYRLVRHLATGGMAEVYLAELEGAEGLIREVVIKRILPQLAVDETFVDMFLDEARIALQLSHPNIGQILELGQERGQFFIAMEYIDGAPLDAVLDSGFEIPVDTATRIVADVLAGLDFAHDAKSKSGNPLGIVHRDVTPHNVMVSLDGHVRLVDFGVAKASERDTKTQTGAVKGKFAYMAPEQVESRDVDRRADVFSAGVLLYELLTREKPFGEDLVAVSRILNDTHQDPRELRPEVPEPLVMILDKALKKNRDERYPTARAMMLDLETALRMTNSYAGEREVASLIRQTRGLEPLEPEAIGVADTGIFAADRSADGRLFADTSAERSLRETSEKSDIALLETAAALDVAAVHAKGGAGRPAKPAGGRLLVVGGGVAAALLALLVVAVVSASGGERTTPLEIAEVKEVVLNVDPLVEAEANPGMLYNKKGRDVVIDSIPSTRLYVRGKLVGTTPHQTRLKPGRHTVQLEVDGKRENVSVTVDRTKALQRARWQLDNLRKGERTPDGAKKRKGGAVQKFKSTIQNLF